MSEVNIYCPSEQIHTSLFNTSTLRKTAKKEHLLNLLALNSTEALREWDNDGIYSTIHDLISLDPDSAADRQRTWSQLTLLLETSRPDMELYKNEFDGLIEVFSEVPYTQQT